MLLLIGQFIENLYLMCLIGFILRVEHLTFPGSPPILTFYFHFPGDLSLTDSARPYEAHIDYHCFYNPSFGKRLGK